MKRYKLGYTTGVFDLFHIGHLNILKQAKDYCEFLIVGVSTDELAIEYKQKKPIIPYEERIKIVESVKYVDKVIPQSSFNKLEVWRQYKFDVIFHGDDWKETSLYKGYEDSFREYGVDIIYFPHTEGTSSTTIADILSNKYLEVL